MRKADNQPPSCAVVTKSGSLKFLEPSGPVQACNGTALPSLMLHMLDWKFKIQLLRLTYIVPYLHKCAFHAHVPMVGNSQWLYIQGETNAKLNTSHELKLWDLCRYHGAVRRVT